MASSSATTIVSISRRTLPYSLFNRSHSQSHNCWNLLNRITKSIILTSFLVNTSDDPSSFCSRFWSNECYWIHVVLCSMWKACESAVCDRTLSSILDFAFTTSIFFCPHFGCAFLLILEFKVLQLILTVKWIEIKCFKNADQIRDKFTLRFTSVFPYIFVDFNTIIPELFARWHLVWFLICLYALFFLASIYMDYFGLSFIPTSKIFCTSI